MKHKLVTAALLLAALAGGYWLGTRQHAAPAAPPAAAGRQPLYWHDPMVPGQKFDKPGKSPYMDMPLVPVYADEGAAPGTVSISPRVQQNLGVRTVQVVSAPLPQSVTAVGNVAFNERLASVVQARAAGYVERVLVRAPLQRVRKGQALAEVVLPDWVAAQEEFLAVRRMPSADAALLEGARQRLLLAGLSAQQLRQLEQGGRVLARQTLSAPDDGVVAELAAREGMSVAMGTTLYRINGLSSVWVNAELPENQAALVAPGSTVMARAAALPERELHGTVEAILPQVDPATRTVRARIELANPDGRLLPGMFVSLQFSPPQQAPALLVPSEAVIRTGTRNVVLLEQGAGKFAPVEVQLGGEANGMTEIRAGLLAGQKVVLSGQFLMDSEASLKGSALRLGDAAAPAHRGEGVVEAIDKEEITLSHGPIATLKWPAMTMAFKLPRGGLPPGLAVGAHVRFEFVQAGDGVFQITLIAPVAAPAHQHGGRP